MSMSPAISAMPVRPEDILADDANKTEIDGVTMRKGTVAAFLQNAMRWMDAGTNDADREVLESEIIKALPALRALGVFTIFECRDEHLRALIARH